MANITGQPAREGLAEIMTVSAEHDVYKHDYVAAVSPTADKRVRFEAVESKIQVLVPAASRFANDIDVRGIPNMGGGLAEALFTPKDGTVRLDLTPTFRSQLYERLGTMIWPGTSKRVPADFADSIPAKVAAGLFNGLADELATSQRWMIRGYQGTARALVAGGKDGRDVSMDSGVYPRFWNTEILDLILMAFEENAVNGRGGGDLTDPRLILHNVTPDDLYIRVLWGGVSKTVHLGGRDVDMHGGFCVSHRETGDGLFTISPMTWNPICTNTAQVDSLNTLKVFHRGSKRSKMVQVKVAIGEALRLTPKLVDMWVEAEADHVEDFSDIMMGLAVKQGWDLKTTMAVNQPSENTPYRPTRAGLVDLLTDASQRISSSHMEQVELDKLAGAILAEPGSIFAEARRLARDASRTIDGRGRNNGAERERLAALRDYTSGVVR